MKVKTSCCLVLLMLTALSVSAQQITRCGGPPSTTSVNWPNFRFDLCKTGNNPYEHTLTPSTVGKLELKWSYLTTGNVVASPAVASGMVYVIAEDGHLYALNADSGALEWMYSAGFYHSSPAVDMGMVYAASAEEGLYALDAASGAFLWNYKAAGTISESSPVVADGVVYVGSDNGTMYALNAATGGLLWSNTIAPYIFSSPAVVNGVVYTGCGLSVCALNAKTGALLWNYDAAGAVLSSPAVSNGFVYVTSWDKNLLALSDRTGELVWLYETFDYISSSPAIAKGIVYVTVTDFINGISSGTTALNANTGAFYGNKSCHALIPQWWPMPLFMSDVMMAYTP